MNNICIFAGTSEGRRLVELLAGRGASLTVCVATEYGSVLLGDYPDCTVLAGRKNTAEMTELFRGGNYIAVVDATHPYADVVTESILSACEETGSEYIRLQRGSTAAATDGIFTESTESCVELLKKTEGNILLTTGSKTLPLFAADPELRSRLWARVLPMESSLKICAEAGVAPARILAMQGPFSVQMNTACLKMADAKWMVTKDTGTAGGYEEKLEAARAAGASVIIIGRPPQREGLSLSDVEKLIAEKAGLAPYRKQVFLIGIGMGQEETRTLGMMQAVHDAELVIGAKRMLESLDLTGKETAAAILSSDIADRIHVSAARSIAVLFSGDTGFYSGAATLPAMLGDCDVRIIPGVGSLSYFCARLQRPWQDVRAVSLHGRECNFLQEVRSNPAVFTLIGGKDGVKNALQRLCNAGLGGCSCSVGERLGYPEERILQGTAESLLEMPGFDALSVLLVENPDAVSKVVTHGLPDEVFSRDPKTPMTKAEVRSISLSKLALTSRAIVYDIGSGSGSCSIECAMQSVQGHVYAIERKADALELTKSNTEKFGIENLTVVAGTAPDALKDLPAPTHAFIGGSSGNLAEIVECLLEKNPDVRIVATAVTLETIAELTELLPQFETAEAVSVSVARDRTAGRYHLMTAQNPVYIVTLQHKKTQDADQ